MHAYRHHVKMVAHADQQQVAVIIAYVDYSTLVQIVLHVIFLCLVLFFKGLLLNFKKPLEKMHF